MEGTVLWLVGARRWPRTRVRALRTEPPHHNVNLRARALLPVRLGVREVRFGLTCKIFSRLESGHLKSSSWEAVLIYIYNSCTRTAVLLTAVNFEYGS